MLLVHVAGRRLISIFHVPSLRVWSWHGRREIVPRFSMVEVSDDIARVVLERRPTSTSRVGESNVEPRLHRLPLLPLLNLFLRLFLPCLPLRGRPHLLLQFMPVRRLALVGHTPLNKRLTRPRTKHHSCLPTMQLRAVPCWGHVAARIVWRLVIHRRRPAVLPAAVILSVYICSRSVIRAMRTAAAALRGRGGVEWRRISAKALLPVRWKHCRWWAVRVIISGGRTPTGATICLLRWRPAPTTIPVRRRAAISLWWRHVVVATPLIVVAATVGSHVPLARAEVLPCRKVWLDLSSLGKQLPCLSDRLRFLPFLSLSRFSSLRCQLSCVLLLFVSLHRRLNGLLSPYRIVGFPAVWRIILRRIPQMRRQRHIGFVFDDLCHAHTLLLPDRLLCI
mmetsp:Transcript_19423/g.34624  ORF Transcript_19423/g.34624 Transcript_19423/m.34624 type:complete len:393 (-) Transcript_19423:28-1206(-)